MMESVGVADRNRDLTDADAPRIAKRRPRQRPTIGRRRPDHREIRIVVSSDEISAQRSSVGQHDGQSRRAMDDVAVRQNETVRREDDAGARGASRFYFDDGGSNDFDGADHGSGIRVEQIEIGIGTRMGRHDVDRKNRRPVRHHPDG